MVRATMFLNLLTAVLQNFTATYDGKGEIDRTTFEMIFIYCLAWSMGGMFETDDRVKFHKEILEKAKAPLPLINP